MLVAAGGTGPVFNEDGKLAGFIVRQADEDGQGGVKSDSEIHASFILSAEDLARATAMAQKVN
jgi:hypothetical protein